MTVLEADGEEATEPAAALSLTYRDSRLKHGAEEGSASDAASALAAAGASAGASAGDLILTATFRLAPADPTAIKVRMDEIRRWRREHQPLNRPSAGRVFRNPPGDSAGRRGHQREARQLHRERGWGNRFGRPPPGRPGQKGRRGTVRR